MAQVVKIAYARSYSGVKNPCTPVLLPCMAVLFRVWQFYFVYVSFTPCMSVLLRACHFYSVYAIFTSCMPVLLHACHFYFVHASFTPCVPFLLRVCHFYSGVSLAMSNFRVLHLLSTEEFKVFFFFPATVYLMADLPRRSYQGENNQTNY